MTCFNPRDAWYATGCTDKGKRPVVFKRPDSWPRRSPSELKLPCGECVGCSNDYANAFAIRCVHEAKLHKFNSFLTVTYDDDYLPKNGSLCKRDIDLFLKRLRKTIAPDRIKVFGCGEYGDKTLRPHYHLCIFGYCPDDGIVIRQGKDPLYTSVYLGQLWSKGYVNYGNVSFGSAAYVAGYIFKKRRNKGNEVLYKRVDGVTGECVDVVPEFTIISNGGRKGSGGIASEYYKRFGSDLYPADEAVINGRKVTPPRYYDKKLEEVDPDLLARIKEQRISAAIEHKENSTWERLKVREQVALARLKSNRKVQL